jgi:large subunit ribosomal protein L30
MTAKQAAKQQGPKVRVRQTRSTAGRSAHFQSIVCALGLGRIGRTRDVTVNAATLGMLKKVSHIVEIEEIK